MLTSREGWCSPEELYALFSAVRDRFIRYPAVDVHTLEQRLIQLKNTGRLTVGDHISGREILNKGLSDLRANEQTEEALLVLIGAWRLRTVLDIPSGGNALPDPPEHLLFSKLEARLGRGAHSAYNALIRRLVSAENALGV